MQYINMFVIKDVIISEKAREKKLLEGPVDITVPAEIARAINLVDLAWRYKWAMSNVDIDTVKKLGLIEVKKYWRRVGQVERE